MASLGERTTRENAYRSTLNNLAVERVRNMPVPAWNKACLTNVVQIGLKAKHSTGAPSNQDIYIKAINIPTHHLLTLLPLPLRSLTFTPRWYSLAQSVVHFASPSCFPFFVTCPLLKLAPLGVIGCNTFR